MIFACWRQGPMRDWARSAAAGSGGLVDHAGKDQSGHSRGRDSSLLGGIGLRSDPLSRLSQGNLELNHLMPLVADSLLTAIDLLARGSRLLAERCIAGIHANRQRCRAYVESATATSTALVGRLGYHVAEEVATTARRENRTCATWSWRALCSHRKNLTNWSPPRP